MKKTSLNWPAVCLRAERGDLVLLVLPSNMWRVARGEDKVGEWNYLGKNTKTRVTPRFCVFYELAKVGIVGILALAQKSSHSHSTLSYNNRPAPQTQPTTLIIEKMPRATIKINTPQAARLLPKPLSGVVNLWADRMVLEGNENISDPSFVTISLGKTVLGHPTGEVGSYVLMFDTTTHINGHFSLIIEVDDEAGQKARGELSVEIRN